MIINNSPARLGAVLESPPNTAARQGSGQSSNNQRTNAQTEASAGQVIPVRGSNPGERIDLRILNAGEVSYQQQRALGIYLATEYSADDASSRPLVDITA